MGINRDKVLSAARKHVRKGKWSRALKEYEKLADDDPSDARSRLKIADLNAKLDRTTEALDAYRSVAQFYASDDMYEKAVAIYKQAIRLDSDNPELQCKVGEAYHRLGRLKDAVRAYHKAQKIYRERNDSAAQRDVLERMVQLDPEDVGLRIQLAERYAKDNRTERAIELFEKAATDLDEEGRLDEWLRVAERLIYLREEDIPLRKRVVKVYLDRSDNKHALKHLQVCFKKQPDDVETLRLLAHTFERLDRMEKAVMVLVQLANGYTELGREREAQDVWKHVLELDPTHRSARKHVGRPEQSELADSDVMTADNVEDTGVVRNRNQTPAGDDDALDGIEFLDEDDDEDLEAVDVEPVREHAPSPETNQPTRSARGASGEDFQEFSGELSDLDISSLDQRAPGGHSEPATDPPAAEAEPDRPARTPEQDSRAQWSRSENVTEVKNRDEEELVDISESIEVIETVDPTVDHEPEVDSREEKIREQLKETEVFLKYGLYDKAEEIIGGIVREAPDSIQAREKMRELYRATGEKSKEADELVALARITRTTPKRARSYLEQAYKLADDPQRVVSAAERFGVELQVDVHSNEEVEPIEEVQEISADDSFVEIDFDDAMPADDSGDFVDLDDDDMAGLVESTQVDNDEGTQGPGQHSDGMLESSSVVEVDELSMDEAEEIDIDEASFVEMDVDDSSFAEFDIEEGSLSEMSDDAGFVEMDVDSEQGFEELSEQDLIQVDDEQAGKEDVELYVTEEEADAMFDDLFADVAHTGENINLGGDDPLGEMADVDFYLQQGLVTEAEEELEEYRDQNPDNPGVRQRADQIRSAREGRSPQENPFGSRSLSQAFRPNAALDEDSYILDELQVSNTNLELGEAYMDMGLYEDAIGEFEHALDDPDAAGAAQYQIALCHHKLGDVERAAQELDSLLETDSVSDKVRQAAMAARAELTGG